MIYITVRELKELLNNYNDNDLVIIQKDEEGNGFSPLYEILDVKYVADTEWSGEVFLRELTQELREIGFTEEDVSESGEDAIVLVPIN